MVTPYKQMQESMDGQASMVEGKTVTTDHPVAYVSGLFRGSQLNWAALTKEAFAIYMSCVTKTASFPCELT